MIKVLFFLSLTINIFAINICEKEFANMPQAKEYIRIVKHIEEHHSSCDVIYAYSLFLNDPLMMDELEDDPVFAEEFGHFAKKYPYLAKLIQDKETFEYFNRKYDIDKQNINETIRYIFKKPFTKKDAGISLMYLQFALDIVGDNYDSKTLKKTIQYLKAKYSPQFLDVVLPLWNIYQKKYRQIPVSRQDYFNNFSKIVDNYGFPLLKKMENYQDEIFPVLLPEKYGNMEYVNTIKSFLNIAMGGKSLEQKIFFLKYSYIDMQIALESGKSKEKIVNFYKPYMKQTFIQRFDKLNQHEKAGIVMLVGDHLEGKLDWMEFDKRSYRMVTNAILKMKNIESTINLLGLYNYASTLFDRMKTKQQKEMLVNLVQLPSKNNNATNNLSLIYALGEHTSYFNAIINKNNKMYDNDKYKEILYIRREGKSILSLFAEGDNGYQKFVSQVNDLITTPYDEIHDLTWGEKMNYALETVDYASYAMMIVPGAGIAVNIGKSLLVNGIKVTAKSVAKAGVREVIGSYHSVKSTLKGMKSIVKKTWKNGLKNNHSSTKPINYHLRGKTHPKTGVPYNRLGYPIFDSKFNCRLPFHLVRASEMAQFKFCTNKLREYLKRYPEYKKNFSKEQLHDINFKKPRIDKYTWHHHQAKSTRLVQLVDRELHDKTAHTGGRAIFGGGKAGRMGKSNAVKNSFVKNFFSNQTLSNQLAVIAQSTKYGEKYFSAVKKATKISSKSLQNLKFSVPKVPIQTLTTRTVQKKFVETLNKTGKYGWQRLQSIGHIMAKYPKSAAASAAYLWYIADPNGFEKALEHSGKTLTEFVLTSMASVGQGASTVIADKGKKFYDEKVNELTKSIEQKVSQNIPYIVQSIVILLIIILLLFVWHKRHTLQALLIKKNQQSFNYRENDREY